jgi:hypothetical protein
MYWPINGVFRASENRRMKSHDTPYAEWEEYMITWVLPMGVSKEED